MRSAVRLPTNTGHVPAWSSPSDAGPPIGVTPDSTATRMIDEIDELEDAFDPGYNQRGPSKSSRKRQSTALQDLGEELMALSREQLARLDLPEDLLGAVRVGQSITAHGGLQRQRKFIGKLLRSLDAEPIRAGLVALRGETAGQVRLQHACERWRDRMLLEGDPVINDFVAEHPEAERQKLRQSVRDAQRERDAQQAPRAARLLYRYLRECMAQAIAPTESGAPDEADTADDE